jgi:hypothetical protein
MDPGLDDMIINFITDKMEQSFNISIDNWGSATWRSMHAITLTYPDNPTPEIQDNYKLYFFNIQKVLPCGLCRAHFKEVLLKTPPDTSSRTNLVRWLFNVHNMVNVNTNKPMYLFSTYIYEYLPPVMYQMIELSDSEKAELLELNGKPTTTPENAELLELNDNPNTTPEKKDVTSIKPSGKCINRNLLILNCIVLVLLIIMIICICICK